MTALFRSAFEELSLMDTTELQVAIAIGAASFLLGAIIACAI